MGRGGSRGSGKRGQATYITVNKILGRLRIPTGAGVVTSSQAERIASYARKRGFQARVDYNYSSPQVQINYRGSRRGFGGANAHGLVNEIVKNAPK